MKKWLALGMLAAVGCSSTTTFVTNNVIATDGGDAAPVVVVDAGAEAAVDAGTDSADAADAKVCAPSTLVTSGTSREVEPVGTGQPTFCDPACGLPANGYVVVGGAIPTLSGCSHLTGTGNFCCPPIACVRDTAHDVHCSAQPNGHIYNWSCAESPSVPGNPAGTIPPNCIGSLEPSPAGIIYECCDSP